MLAALEDLFGDDPLLKEFLHGLKDGDGDMKMGNNIDQFVENNPDLPGMDRFSKLMQRGTLPDRIL